MVDLSQLSEVELQEVKRRIFKHTQDLFEGTALDPFDPDDYAHRTLYKTAFEIVCEDIVKEVIGERLQLNG